jgi:hypothetical protein
MAVPLRTWAAWSCAVKTRASSKRAESAIALTFLTKPGHPPTILGRINPAGKQKEAQKFSVGRETKASSETPK